MTPPNPQRLLIKVTLLRETHPELFDKLMALSPRLRASKLRELADDSLHQAHSVVQLVSAPPTLAAVDPAPAPVRDVIARPVPVAPTPGDDRAARRALAAAFAGNQINQQAFSIDADKGDE